MSTSRLEIDLSRLDENLAEWRKLLGPHCALCAVVKADGYGLGAVPIARRLAAAGVKLLAVYNADQAAAIAATGIPVQILILMPIEHIARTDALYRSVVCSRLHLTVHSAAQLDKVQAIGTTYGATIPVHVEIDTGMSRGGMLTDEADRVLASIAKRRYVKLAGLFTHSACPDDDIGFTDRQLQRFDELIKRNAPHIGPDVAIHFAGTHAALRDRRYHKTTARIGLGLLGYGRSDIKEPPIIADPPALRPVLRWTSRIVHVHDVPAQTPVGYAGLYTTDRPSRLGVVPVGYGDGYPLALSNRAIVRVACNEKQLAPAPVRGRVNMDQIIVDLTGLAQAGLGSEVELIASDPSAPNALEKLAAQAATNCYELLCRLSGHIQRRYVITNRLTGQVGHVATV